MMRRYVNQLSNGEAVDEIYLVADKQLRANRQGNLYLHLDLRDKTGTIGAKLWNATEELARRFEAGDYVAMRGKVHVHQGALQLILSFVDPINPIEIDANEFLAQGPHDISKLLARLRELLMGMSEPYLRALAECFLIDDEFLKKFTQRPPASRTTTPTTAAYSNTWSPS